VPIYVMHLVFCSMVTKPVTCSQSHSSHAMYRCSMDRDESEQHTQHQ
jgi:hypothetical protein